MDTIQKPMLMLSQHIQDSIVKHCNQSSLFKHLRGQLEIDGIICMSVQSRHDIVVKIHRTVSVLTDEPHEKSEHQSCPSLTHESPECQPYPELNEISEIMPEKGKKQQDQCVLNDNRIASSCLLKPGHSLPPSSSVDQGLYCIKSEPTVQNDPEEDVASSAKPESLTNSGSNNVQKGGSTVYTNQIGRPCDTLQSTSSATCKSANFDNIYTASQDSQCSTTPSNEQSNPQDFNKRNYNDIMTKPAESVDNAHTYSGDLVRPEPELIKLDEDDDDIYEVDNASAIQPSSNALSRKPGTFLRNDGTTDPFCDDDFVGYLESKAAAAKASSAGDQHDNMGHLWPIETPFECGVCTTYFSSNETLIEHMNTHVKHRVPARLVNQSETEFSPRLDTTDDNDIVLEELTAIEDNEDTTNLDLKILTCESLAEVSENEKCNIASQDMVNDDNVPNTLLKLVDSQDKDEYDNNTAPTSAVTGFECDICHKTLSSRQLLRLHMRTHTVDKPFQCEVCSGCFTTKCSLQKHMLHIHEKSAQNNGNELNLSKCKVCSKTFKVRSHLLLHMKVHEDRSLEPASKRNTLSIQSDTTDQLSQLSSTEASQTKLKPYKCNICLKRFKFKNFLSLHMKTHHNTHKPQKDKLNKQLRVKTPEKPYKCLKCYEEFPFKKYLKVHVHTCNKGKDKVDVSDNSLKMSNNSVSIPVGGNVKRSSKISKINTSTVKRKKECHPCKMCHKVLASKMSLSNHIRRHTGEKPYNCSICNKSFHSQENISYHMRIHHASNYGHDSLSTTCKDSSHRKTAYQCDICGKYLSKASTLLLHIKRHTGDKPYKCNLCSYSNIRKRLRDNHLLTHTGEKKFSCLVCNKMFYTKENMESHLVIHTGEKPYSCPVCDKKFAHKSSVWYHRKQLHPNQ